MLAHGHRTFSALGWPGLTPVQDVLLEVDPSGENLARSETRRDVRPMTRRPFICVYMMTNRKHGTLYIGVTANLIARVGQHREGEVPGFTATYGLKRLVWYEQHETIVAAIQREKSLKKYRRDWKINLIERDNPHWDDLFLQFF